MPRVIYVRQLMQEDARAIARIEKTMYARNQRNGRRAIAGDLRDAEREHTNLCVGLFDGARLVGCILAYLYKDRASAFERFEVSHDDAARLNGACVYVEDVVLLPRYSRNIFLIFSNWQRELRRRAPGLPIDAFCTPELLARWRKYSRFFRHLGVQLDRSVKVRDLTQDEEWYWISWRQLEGAAPQRRSGPYPGTSLGSVQLPEGYRARFIQTASDWQSIRRDWDNLVDKMRDAGGFLSFDFLYTWWHHYGLSRQLMLILLYNEDSLIGIAPLMVAPKRILASYRWRLEFIGDNINMERPELILDETHDSARELLWRCILSTESRWDAAYLREQTTGAADHPVAHILDQRRFTLSQSPPMDSPYVVINQPFETYFAERSRALRKGFRRRHRQLREAGDLQFLGHADCPDSRQCLTDYIDVESRSWKGKANLGVSGHVERTAYYYDLAGRLGRKGELHFRILLLDSTPIAATFGVFRNGHFASLEICHDQEFDQYSPGVVLTGLELEECHASAEYAEYDFLIGTYNNKRPWGTDSHRAWNLYILPKTVWGRINRLLIFSLKPRLEAFLSRYKLMDKWDHFLERVERVFR